METWMIVSLVAAVVLLIACAFIKAFLINPKILRSRMEGLSRRGYQEIKEPDNVLLDLYPLLGEDQRTTLTLRFGVMNERDGVKRYLCYMRQKVDQGNETNYGWIVVLVEARQTLREVPKAWHAAHPQRRRVG